MPATKFVNIGITGGVKTKDPSSDGLMPDMSTGTTDITKIVEDSVTFEVNTSENFSITPQDMSLPWHIGNPGSMDATLSLQTYNYDPNLLVLAFGGNAIDTGSDGIEDEYEAPTTGFDLTYKAFQVEGDTVDGYRLSIQIPKAAVRGIVHAQFGNSAGNVEYSCQVVTPEDSSGVLQPPWYVRMLS
ncbi:hypothetical protein [Methanohalobium sp.]|uniref:hypothetical protein n=1 Tax=Methanohalobium sp. TaxID=2837493 RepID=UPI0025FA6B77|nr:hypothetical protein [Methanohalobium sp.]